MRSPILPRPIRRRLRRPSIYLTSAVCLAALTGATAYRHLESMADGAHRYGRPVRVAVARDDIRPGDRLDDDAVELRELPTSAVAPTALRSASRGRVARRAVSAGEVLVAGDLTVPGTSELAAALPEGTVALAVPRGDAPLRVSRGDRIDLLAAVDPDGDGGLVPVARDATVVASDRSSITVAVSEEEAGDVAAAVAAAVIVPAVRGG